MKSLITLLSILSIPFNTFSTIKKIETTLDSVTIFTRDAQLNRSRYVDLRKGENILQFSKLELSVKPNSIQLFGINNNKNITVISTRFFKREKPNPKGKESSRQINDSLQKINHEIKLLGANIQNLKREKDLVLAHAKITYDKQVDYVKLVKTMLSYYRESAAELDRRILSLEAKTHQKNELRYGLEGRLSTISKRNYQGVIEAKIYAEQPIKQNLQLSYLVSEVSWTPFYDIKANGTSKPLEVSCKATISQNTGIDWTNIKLTLSTRKQTSLTAIPEVHPWVLHFQNSYRRYQQNNLIIDQQAISNSSVPLSTSSNANKNEMETRTNQYLSRFKAATHKMINKEYRSKIRHTIAGDSGLAVMEIDQFKMQTQYKYFSVPKYDPDVYLVAKVAAYKQYDLIPAFANVFLEGIYVGKLFINPGTINSSLDLMLGRDNDIVIDRRKINQALEKRRKIKGNIETTTIEIELNVENRKNSAVDLIIKDQVPISGQEGISVDVLRISGAKLDSVSGTLTWHKNLAPKKSHLYGIKYEIIRPKNKKLANF